MMDELAFQTPLLRGVMTPIPTSRFNHLLKFKANADKSVKRLYPLIRFRMMTRFHIIYHTSYALFINITYMANGNGYVRDGRFLHHMNGWIKKGFADTENKTPHIHLHERSSDIRIFLHGIALKKKNIMINGNF